jgi:hypothetical protein
MINRQKLETLLSRRFPGSTCDQIAIAANAIMCMDGEWEEVGPRRSSATAMLVQCPEISALAREAEARAEFRLPWPTNSCCRDRECWSGWTNISTAN